jgi:hypothetical protein
MKLKLTIEVEYDAVLCDITNKEEWDWFKNDVLLNTLPGEELILHSNCIGDSLGVVKVLTVGCI